MMAALLSLLRIAADEPRHALVFAMLLSYALGFAGMLLAYLSYRKRRKSPPGAPEKHEPPAAKEPER
jgi:cytochrome c biogenesis protein CcdA